MTIVLMELHSIVKYVRGLAAARPLTYLTIECNSISTMVTIYILRPVFCYKRAMHAFSKFIKFIYNSCELKKLLTEHNWDDLPFLDLGILLDVIDACLIFEADSSNMPKCICLIQNWMPQVSSWNTHLFYVWNSEHLIYLISNW